MFTFISKKIADIKILQEGYTANYFLNRMNSKYVIIKKKSGTDIFYQIIAHVHFTEILSGYFLFSRFDWSISVTQLVAKHMKEIIKGIKHFSYDLTHRTVSILIIQKLVFKSG
jgi:hypothetical protein